MAPPLIALVGPTCTGKTRLAVALAQALGGELVNADSRQLRRGLRVGTCAPSASDLRGVACHLLEQADPGEDYTVANWLAQARPIVDALQARGVRPIVVGGTGLYVTALVDGYDLGAVAPDPAVRAARTRRAMTAEGLAELVAELARHDPDALSGVDARNPRRVVRALEIVEAGERPLRSARGSTPRPALLLGLDAPPGVHAGWIEARCGAMFAGDALADEVSAALRRGCSPAALRGCGIGYAEALAVLDGALTTDEAVQATIRRTIRYAKAQRSYFRRDRRIQWLPAAEGPDALLRRSLALVTAATADTQKAKT